MHPSRLFLLNVRHCRRPKANVTVLFLVLFLFVPIYLVEAHYPVEQTKGHDERLILTSFLRNGNDRLLRGRELARVTNMASTESYSGFFRVNTNSLFNSNVFFWFFPAQYRPSNAPVILSLGGSVSSLYNIFNSQGPFYVDQKSDLHRRANPWSASNNMIFMDGVIGAGFSFTDDPAGYAKSTGNVADNVYMALLQFFQLFPEFQSREFYVAGEASAAKVALAVAHKIHEENVKSKSAVINLRGLVLGAPFIDPINQLDYGNFLYSVGLVDDQERMAFQQLENITKGLIQKQKWGDAFKVGESIMVGYPLVWDSIYTRNAVQKSLYKNVTGFKYNGNYKREVVIRDLKYYVAFLDRDNIRHAIHVGQQPYFHFQNTSIYYAMKGEVYKSAKTLLEQLLEAQNNYKVLIYAGQLDPLVPHTTVAAMIKALQWSGSSEYEKASKIIYRVNNEVAGYTKTAKNLVYTLIRNAGNFVSNDQQLWTFDMINRFTETETK